MVECLWSSRLQRSIDIVYRSGILIRREYGLQVYVIRVRLELWKVRVLMGES